MPGANPATARNPTANPSSQAPRSSPRQSEIAPSAANAAAKVKPNERFDAAGASSGRHNVSCEDPERRRARRHAYSPSVLIDGGILIRSPYRGRGTKRPRNGRDRDRAPPRWFGQRARNPANCSAILDRRTESPAPRGVQTRSQRRSSGCHVVGPCPARRDRSSGARSRPRSAKDNGPSPEGTRDRVCRPIRSPGRARSPGPDRTPPVPGRDHRRCIRSGSDPVRPPSEPGRVRRNGSKFSMGSSTRSIASRRLRSR